MLFRKCGCLVAHGKWIFRKRISVDRKIKAFDSENIFSQNFTFKSFSESRKERKRERKDSHAQIERERERSWTQKSGDRRTTDEIVEPTNSESHEPTNPRTANPRPTNGEPMNHESHRADRTGKSHRYWSRYRSRYRRVAPLPISFLWFWFFTFSLWSLIFLLLLWWCGWWCFGGFPVVWWWVLCRWWWKIVFSECYQTQESIF